MSADDFKINSGPRGAPATSTTIPGRMAPQSQAQASVELPVQRRAEPVAASKESVEQVAQRIQSYLKSVSRSLEFRVDAASGRTVVSVRDAETGDLIRQIPGEEVLRLAEMAQDDTIVLIRETA